MIDFILSVIITIVITLITIFLDSVAAKMLALSRMTGKILTIDEQINANTLNQTQLEDKIKKAAKNYRIAELQRNIWGGELAVVAVSLDFTAIGIWFTNKDFFPFFSRFNSTDIDRAILVIFIVILAHILLFLFSLIAKNIHTEQANEFILTNIPSLFTKEGWKLNKWKFATNSTGFIALLSAIVVFTNSI